MRNFRKPLFVMTPKSLLRHPKAVSPLKHLSKGAFLNILLENRSFNYKEIQVFFMCNGKVYYDLREFLDQNGKEHIPVIRFEQIYPFPHEDFMNIFHLFPNFKRIYYVQEEPKNMGAWLFLKNYIKERLGKGQKLDYIGREPSGTTATGVSQVHKREKEGLLNLALKVCKKF